MPRRRLLAASAAVLFATSLFAVSSADAGWRWRRARWSAPRTTNTYQAWQRARRPSTRITYSGVSRAEQDFWRQRDAWYDHAFNGWRPEDFR
ncbi:MAG: hypothetical protein AAF589_09310 [Planctomycetota bacterium]